MRTRPAFASSYPFWNVALSSSAVIRSILMVRGGRKNGAEEALVVVRIEDFFNEDTFCVIIVQEKPLHFK